MAGPWSPPPASWRSTGTMPLVSCTLAGLASIARGMPYVSTAMLTFTPRILLPPSTPRAMQFGAEGQVRLSITTVLGSAVSPQASRRVRRSRSADGAPARAASSGRTSTSGNASQDAGVVLAGRTAVPMECTSKRPEPGPQTYQTAPRSASAGTHLLRTHSEGVPVRRRPRCREPLPGGLTVAASLHTSSDASSLPLGGSPETPPCFIRSLLY